MLPTDKYIDRTERERTKNYLWCLSDNFLGAKKAEPKKRNIKCIKKLTCGFLSSLRWENFRKLRETSNHSVGTKMLSIKFIL